MSRDEREIDGFRRARRYRRASRIALGAWASAWVALGICVATDRDANIVSALAVVICLLFAAAIVLEASAWRLERRELDAIARRDDLSAARSRGSLRVR